MATRGGKRPGAGRKAGSLNKTTADIKALAQLYGADAIDALADIMKSEKNPPAARVAAARELLDRAFGKASQPVGQAADLQPLTLAQLPDISDLTDEQLDRLDAIAAKAAGAGAGVD